MTRAPGKSCLLGLLLGTFAFFSTACQSISLMDTGQPGPDNLSANQVKLLVQENGLFAVSQQELVQFGLEIEDMSRTELRLTQAGKIVPTFIEDDHLIFYGQAPQSRYTNVRPYLLEVGRQGTDIQETAVANATGPLVTEVPQTLHLEENQIYKAEARQNEEDDVWFWSELKQQESFDTEFEILNLVDAPAVMRINSWGYTNIAGIEGDHDFDLLLNDKNVGTVIWDGQTFNSSDTDIPAGTLVEGTNKITLDNRTEGASFLDISQVNWLELEYLAPAQAIDDQLTFSAVDGLVQMSGFGDEPLIFNISDAANPELLVDWKFGGEQVLLPVTEEMVIAAAGPDGFKTAAIAPFRESDWHNPEQQADLLIITTDELAPFLAPLVQAREAQGLSVTLVPLADIYDEFGYGESTPESIRQFVTYAYENWQEPRPQYLFLVGDATTDYLGHITELPPNMIPSLLVPVQFSGETVSDSRLVDVDGDRKPDLAVGRWPVRTAQEVENLVERTLNYEQGIASDKMIFASDGSEVRFSSIVKYLAKKSQIPAEQYHHLDGPQTQEITERWNEGAWLATYVGHGSIARWGKENIFNVDSLSSLENETPPIVLQLTCLTGLFSHPVETSLAEAMLTQPEGPVLTVAATSLTLSGHQEPFAIQLLEQIQDSNIIRIGDAFQEAKISLEIDNADGLREISDTFALFGDPSTTIIRP